MDILEEFMVFWKEHADKRAAEWFMLSSPVPILLLVNFYAIMARVILPSAWKGEKHLEHKNILGAYFILHSFISAVFTVVSAVFALRINFDIRCMPVVESFMGVHYDIAFIAYLWMWFKLTEMIETILTIFVFGKVSNFIFVHHILFPICFVFSLHFYLGGSVVMFGLVNNLDHAIVYFMVGLRTLSDNFREKTEVGFKRFHFYFSIVMLSLTIAFYLQLEQRPGCDYQIFKIFVTFGLSIFLFLAVYLRLDYINPKKEVDGVKDDNGVM